MSKYIRHIVLPMLVVFLIFTGTCLIESDNIPKVSSSLPLDKLVHFGMFFVLSFVNSVYYYKLKSGNPSIFKWIFWGFIMPVVYGGIIEVMQERYFGRSSEMLDFIADLLGSASAMILIIFLYNVFSNK